MPINNTPSDSLPPLKSLRAFEAVARHLSVTAAAEELKVTQSAVSHQVRNLEKSLDTQLFTRVGPKLLLTDKGNLLFADLANAFSLIKRSVGKLRAARDESGIGILVRPHFAMNWLSPRSAELSTQLPRLNLHFFHSNDSADFSDPSIHASIEWRHISQVTSEMLLLVPGDLTPACHPDLIRRTGLSEPADLADHTLLHETDETAWQEWLQLAGVPELNPKRKEYYEDTNVRQHTAIAGGGVVLVCPRLIQHDIATGKLVLPFDIKLDSYGYYLIISPDSRDTPQVREFARWIELEARKLIL